MKSSIDYFPCDILFVHRDADGDDPEIRYNEILKAIKALIKIGLSIPHICIVPVRMTEAWLLFNERGIRRAAGNPNGKIDLKLPLLKNVEHLPDPKSVLFDTIKIASGLNSRRQKRLNLPQCRLRLAEIIEDFSPLRALPAFIRFEEDVISFCRSYGKKGES